MTFYRLDFSAETMETFLYYLYNDEVKDTKLVNINLLKAADKYNFRGLLAYCSTHLKSNLTVANASEVLLTAHFTNQEELFNAASDFVCKNKGELVRTKAWKDLLKTNPILVGSVLSNMLGL